MLIEYDISIIRNLHVLKVLFTNTFHMFRLDNSGRIRSVSCLIFCTNIQNRAKVANVSIQSAVCDRNVAGERELKIPESTSARHGVSDAKYFDFDRVQIRDICVSSRSISPSTDDWNVISRNSLYFCYNRILLVTGAKGKGGAHSCNGKTKNCYLVE